MAPDMPLQFGPYVLVGPQGPLWREAQVVPLPPKALAVLWRLASQAGQVVTKATLLDAVWADTAVSEGVLTVCLSTLRQALGEDAKQPRYLATVHRLGYRFVAPVTAGAAPPERLPVRPPLAPVPAAPPLLVGRAAEVAQLQACFVQAQQGGRQTAFVTGEAGVGKTTVVDAFVQQLAPTEALTAVHTTSERTYAAELHRLQGEILLRHKATMAAEAEGCFRQALALAQQQQAKSLELRAALSLSRLWQRQGKRSEARDLLAPIYNWFTEGFDTADLQEAKALLEELRA